MQFFPTELFEELRIIYILREGARKMSQKIDPKLRKTLDYVLNRKNELYSPEHERMMKIINKLQSMRF